MGKTVSSRFLTASHLSRFVATAALVGILLVATSPFIRGQDIQDTVVVRLSKETYTQVADIPTVHAIDYGSFVWLELTTSSFEQLRTAGVAFERQKDPTVLRFQNYEFDTRTADKPPSVPSRLTSTPIPHTPGFYIVQMLGPTKDQWLIHLQAYDLDVLQYYSPHAYLVRTTPEQARRVDELDFVRWVGPYHPAYRIASNLLQRSGIIENVSVTIYDDGQVDGTVDRTIKTIGALGGRQLRQEKARTDEPLTAVVFTMPASALTSVAQLDHVVWISYQMPEWVLEDEISDQIIAGNFDPLEPGYRDWLSSKDVSGDGVTVALVDSGYDTGDNSTAHPDLRGRLIPIDTNGILPGGQPDDDRGHGTHVGGIIAANASLGITDTSDFLMGLGVAPEVSLVVRDDAGPLTDLQRDSVTNGAVASNNSYGIQDANSGYTSDDRTLDELVRDANPNTATVAEPLIIVFSAGNCGQGPPPGTPPLSCKGNTGPTKEAKNVIAVGATENQRNAGDINSVASFSSRGPTGDGRVYPHVVAPGENIISTRSTQPGLSECDTVPAGAPGADPTYSICSGTSMAAPHATGAVALITEWWRGFKKGTDPGPAMVKALLVNGAVDMGIADIPNSDEGWGRINLGNIIDTRIPTGYFDQTTIFTTTGETWAIEYVPADPNEPVKVSLAWTDAPGPGGGGNPDALVNDLDLTLSGRDGTIYHGNVFTNGFSTTGGSADRVDNLENVFIQNPADSFTITVTAADINGDGVPYNGDGTDQDFALICKNCLNLNPFEILEPTSVDPAYAGPYNNPSKIIAHITKPADHLNKSHFTATVGGLPANVVTLYEGSDEYVLEVLPPAQSANGLYDLEVSATAGVQTVSDSETDAVLHADSSNVDAVLVIDRSGSMGYSGYMEPAKDAATLFVDLMSDNDQLGVVSFDHIIEVPHPLAVVDSVSRDAAKQAIASLTDRGLTSIGGGLQEGQNQLTNNGVATHPWAMVLLSDGYENTAPWVNDVLPSIQATKTVIHTISLGPDSDQALMIDIAAQTGGTYSLIPSRDPTVVRQRLGQVYSTIAGAVSGQQTLLSLTGLVQPGETDQKSVVIDSTIAEATFSVNWSNSTSTIYLTLRNPNGNTIDPSAAVSDPNVTHVSGPTYAYYRVISPTLTTGVWKMMITGGSISSSGIQAMTSTAEESYTALVTGRTTGAAVTVHAYFDEISYQANEPIKLSITLSDDQPIPDGEVTAIVGPLVTVGPSPQIQASAALPNPILALYDDGRHGDGLANNGVYANTLDASNTVNEGVYNFQVFATGTASNGDRFARSLQQNVSVGLDSTSFTSTYQEVAFNHTCYLPLILKP